MSHDPLDKHKSIDLEPGRDAVVSPCVVSAGVRCPGRRISPGLTPGINPESHPGLTPRRGPARHAGGMNIYLINALLVLLVVRQIREHQLDLRALAVPVLAVAAAAVMFLHSVPGGGSDIALDLLGVSAGTVMGASAAWPPGCGWAPTAGRWAARVLWRRACGSPSGPGWSSTSPRPTAPPAIAAFSIAHHITGSAAWTAALVMMALADVLTRLAVVWIRGRRLTATGTPVIGAPVQAAPCVS